MRVDINVFIALVAFFQNGVVTAASNSNGKLRKNSYARSLSDIPSNCKPAADATFLCAAGLGNDCGPCITDGFNDVRDDTCFNYETKLVIFIAACDCSDCYDQFSEYYGCVRPECGPIDGDVSGSGGPPWCFSGSNTVQVQQKGVVPMDSLQIGDYLMSANGKFSRVYSFGHMDRDAEIAFLQIHSKGLETPLEISHNHMMFVGDGELVRAADVRVGDMLGEHQVAAIRTVKRRGVYAPLTEKGDLVVSGAAASSYVIFLDYSPRLQHWVSHAIGSPFRLICAFNFGICKNETYIEGLSNYYVPFIKLANKISEYPKTVQLGVTLIGAPIMVSAYVLEQTILSPLLFVSALVLGYIMLKKDYNGKKIRDEGCVVSS